MAGDVTDIPTTFSTTKTVMPYNCGPDLLTPATYHKSSDSRSAARTTNIDLPSHQASKVMSFGSGAVHQLRLNAQPYKSTAPNVATAADEGLDLYAGLRNDVSPLHPRESSPQCVVVRAEE